MTNNKENRVFTRRAFILGIGQGLLLTTIVGRLYYLQILSGDHYRMLADKNRIHAQLLAPQRGQLFDRRGVLLASNHKAFSALVVRTNDNWELLVRDIGSTLNLSEAEIMRIIREGERRPKFMPILVKQQLTWAEVAQLELRLPDWPGVLIEEGQSRLYPDSSTCHVIGYVAAASELEAQEEPLLGLPQLRVGKIGMEKVLDKTLRGTGGIKQLEVNAKRQVVRELAFLPGKAGEDVHLTIDSALQQKAQSLLAPHESGAVVLLDCNTGAVLALASHPGFNPNLFIDGISQDDWQHLNNHPRHALLNKAITGQYAPGSTFKMIVALAALQNKVITNETTVTCCGYLELGQHRFHCPRKGGHGAVDLSLALMYSCDVFFYHIAAKVGIDAIAAVARQWGFGMSTKSGLPSEKAGLVPTRSWKSRVLGRQWQLGETYNAGIGQGYVLATPIQLSVMTAAIANGGTLVTPHLHGQAPPGQSLGVSDEHIALLRQGMFRCVNEQGGTAFSGRILEDGLAMAGKTGTSQVRRITEKERQLGTINRADRLWEHKEHALFVGYAPATSPRFAASVLIEHAGTSKHAVLLGRDLLSFAQTN
ncbi:MAG: penicillin-binding protein 2 [Alphaproteobacteria bacterium]